MSTITTILIFVLISLVLRFFPAARWRSWLLLVVSALAIYWLQPLMPVRNLDFWLPTATLLLVAASWVISTPPEERSKGGNKITALALLCLVILIGLTRFISYEGILTAGRPPQFSQVVLVMLAACAIILILWRKASPSSACLLFLTLFLIVLFIIIKTPSLSIAASRAFRILFSQSPALAGVGDIRWLGFSYVAFRLIHTLRDRKTGRLPAVSLREYVIYVIFFPAFTAGPIDRLERFIHDLRNPSDSHQEDLPSAAQRLIIGLFKKFVLADSLALFALSPAHASHAASTGWTWVMLYAYAFQIYFDFSGYTDIAIGMGRILGIKLPENFIRPYLKPNLTQFWNNWHMTLTHWFRAYFFNPVTRALRRSKRNIAPFWIILITQFGTMLLIGLWHGVTWNFVLWGLWHGLGLFVHNRYAEWAAPRFAAWRQAPACDRFLNALGTLLTFHYVALGWVWFALESPLQSLQVLGRLFGF